MTSNFRQRQKLFKLMRLCFFAAWAAQYKYLKSIDRYKFIKRHTHPKPVGLCAGTRVKTE